MSMYRNVSLPLQRDLANKQNEIVSDNQKMQTLKYEAQIEEQKKNEANR